MSLDDLPLRTLLNNLADTYETVASLPPITTTTGPRRPGKPGSKVPPGVTEILNTEEYDTTLTDIDSWAHFITRILLDEQPGITHTPTTTPGRLRLAAQWPHKLEHHPDPMLRYALRFDAVEHLTMLRRLARRNNRTMRTGSACLNLTCKGQYEAIIDGPEIDGDLICSHCKDRVPHEQWSRWGARTEWVTAQHAANMLGIPINTVRVWAHRYQWQREGTGRDVKYLTADVKGKRRIGASSAA